MLTDYLEEIKIRCGIASQINVYDSEITGLLDDCEHDMLASGVTQSVLESTDHAQQALTAAALYVKAYIGNDRSDSDMYLEMYRNKVFRLTLEDENVE